MKKGLDKVPLMWYNNSVIKKRKEAIKMIFKEINAYDIRNNPIKINEIMTDNVHILSNQLYVLIEGNNVTLDEYTMKALQSLENYLKKVLDKSTKR